MAVMNVMIVKFDFGISHPRLADHEFVQHRNIQTANGFVDRAFQHFAQLDPLAQCP